jgi:hypothetical protein
MQFYGGSLLAAIKACQVSSSKISQTQGFEPNPNRFGSIIPIPPMLHKKVYSRDIYI